MNHDLKDVLALIGVLSLVVMGIWIFFGTFMWIEDMNWGRQQLQKVIDRLNEMEAAKSKRKRK